MENKNGLYTTCRYFAAFMLIMYGFAKINDAQFTVVDWVLDEPLGQVSGFWLTWHYFGYSQVYGLVIALVQVAGGVALLFRRTTLLGSVALAGVMANIVLINVFYGIGIGAMLMSFVITGCLLTILWHHRAELVAVFWAQQKQVDSGKRSVKSQVMKGAIRTLIIVLPVILTYWIANYNNRLPTPIDGAWEVTEAAGEMDDTNLPTHVYFEYNRAYQTAFRYPDGVSRHHFEVDADHGSVEIWKTWLRRDEKVFTGTYDLRGDTLAVDGRFEQEEAQAQLLLSRMR